MYVRTSNIYVVTKRSNKTTVMHLSWKILHLTSTCLISLSGSSASHVVWTLCLSFFCFCFFFFNFYLGVILNYAKLQGSTENIWIHLCLMMLMYTLYTHIQSGHLRSCFSSESFESKLVISLPSFMVNYFNVIS